MQVTTVRRMEKDYDIYLKSEKLVRSQQQHEKNVSQLFGSGKNWFLVISSLTNTVAAIWREKKLDPCYLETKNVVHNCQEQGKRLRHLFKVRKTGSQPVGARKKCFPAIWNLEKQVPSYFEPDKHCCSYLEIEKCGSLLFGEQKMKLTTVRSKEKDYDIYLKSEKLVHSQQAHKKNVSQLLKSGKNWFLAILSLTNTIAAIWREKKVDPCYLETNKCSSQLLGARKKIMTSI